MPEKVMTEETDDITEGNQWPGIDSVFRLVVVAALRSKQIQRGAPSRIEAQPNKRKATSIALEEVKRGKVPFTNGDGSKIISRDQYPSAHAGAAKLIEDSWLV